MSPRINNSAFILIVIFLNSIFIPVLAIDIDSLMGDDAASWDKHEAESTEANVSLDDLMNSSNSNQDKTRHISSDSLLDDVDEGRKELAFDEYQTVQNEVLSHCQCVEKGSCHKKWLVAIPKPREAYQKRVEKAAQKKSNICFKASEIEIDVTVNKEQIQQITASVAGHLDVLKKLDAEMKQRSNDEFAYELSGERHRQEKEKQRQEWHANVQRQVREWEAEDAIEREQLPASYSNSDDDFWAGIQRTQNQTMRNIERNQKAYNQAQKKNQQNTYNNSMYRQDSPPSLDDDQATSTYSQVNAIDAEKQNCVNAGKEWTGSSCDYSTTITIKGSTAETHSEQQWTSSSSMSSSSGSQSNNNVTVSDPESSNIRSDNSTGRKVQNNASSSSVGDNEASKKIIRFIPVFVTQPGLNSWKKEEDACYHSIASATRKAESLCKSEHGGRKTTKSEAPIPVHANCESCRQTNSGNWRCSGNIILQCLLP